MRAVTGIGKAMRFVGLRLSLAGLPRPDDVRSSRIKPAWVPNILCVLLSGLSLRYRGYE